MASTRYHSIACFFCSVHPSLTSSKQKYQEEALSQQLGDLQASAAAAAAAHASEAAHLRTAADEAAQRAQALGQEKEAAEMALAAAGEEQVGGCGGGPVTFS